MSQPHYDFEKPQLPVAGSRRGIAICLTLWLAIIFGAPASGQSQKDASRTTRDTADDTSFHSCTLNLGAGWTPRPPMDANGLDAGWNFQAGGGFAVTSRPGRGHRWSAFLTANFLFNELDVSAAALQEARTLNPTNIGLLQAKSATARFYSTTFDPTFRFPVRGSVSMYVFGGFGWLRRRLEFTGAAVQGQLLQPGSPAVFASGGDSGAFDAGVGVNIRLPKGFLFYTEARVLHGLAINKNTTLVPISAGIRW